MSSLTRHPRSGPPSWKPSVSGCERWTTSRRSETRVGASGAVIGGSRPPEDIALTEVNSEFPDRLELGFGLNAFGDQFAAGLRGEVGQPRDESAANGVAMDVMDPFDIELHIRRLEREDVAETRIPSTRAVGRKLDIRPEPAEGRANRVGGVGPR